MTSRLQEAAVYRGFFCVFRKIMISLYVYIIILSIMREFSDSRYEVDRLAKDSLSKQALQTSLSKGIQIDGQSQYIELV